GRADEGYSLVNTLAVANRQDAGLALQAAQLATGLGRADAALAHAERANQLAPQEMAVLITLTEALLAAGQAERASDMAGHLRRRWSTNQHAMALQATAWRMLGDKRYGDLYDYDAFVWSSFLDVPPG